MGVRAVSVGEEGVQESSSAGEAGVRECGSAGVRE